jgi:hypothetical protein
LLSQETNASIRSADREQHAKARAEIAAAIQSTIPTLNANNTDNTNFSVNDRDPIVAAILAAETR